MRKRNFYVLILLVFFMEFLSVGKVQAVTFRSDPSKCYTYDHSIGNYTSTVSSGDAHSDCMKYLDDNVAYCSEFKSSITSTSYSKDTTWKTDSKSAIVTGLIIEAANKKYSGVQAYAMSAISINAYQSKFLNNPASRGNKVESLNGKWYDNNSVIKKFIDDALDEYKKMSLSTSLPKVTFSGSNTMNYSKETTFISDKIIANLTDSYGNDKITYTISVKSTNPSAGVALCTGSGGTGCSSTMTLTGGTSKVFYVKTTNANSSDSVTITVKGSNSSKYPTSVRYSSNTNSSSQRLMVASTITVKRSGSWSYQLTLPDLTQHKITGIKVDENGNLLEGSTLELYQDSKKLNATFPTKSSIAWISPKVEVGEDDFFNHDYTLKEISSPDGYVLTSTVSDISKDKISNKDSSVCYYDGGGDESKSTSDGIDANHCDFSNLVYKCRKKKTDSNEPDNDNLQDVVEGENCNDSYNTNDGEEDGGEELPEVVWQKVCYSNTLKKVVGMNVDSFDDYVDTYCADINHYYNVTVKAGNITLQLANNMNMIAISKQGITGDIEVPGADLKICTKSDYEKNKEKCTAATTISTRFEKVNDEVEELVPISMEWTSGDSVQIFSGVKAGDYVIIEKLPPAGYVTATTVVNFSMDSNGNVKTGGKTITYDDFSKKGAAIVIKNKLNSMAISKGDVATSKELPGAHISICLAEKDDNGKWVAKPAEEGSSCIVANLNANGSSSCKLDSEKSASWVSGDKPCTISGLPAGTYALVETMAPNGYSTAESIIFTMKEDGTLTDVDGKSLKDNKLVMYDDPINSPETGLSSLYVVILLLIVAGVSSYGVCYFLGKGTNKSIVNTIKIRKRKIHK